MLLQILDDGHLTDAKGRKVDFRNTIIVMTSNVGAELIRRDTSLGFSVKLDEAKSAQQSYEKMKDKVLVELKKTFRPEFLNRIDGVVVFHALSREHIREIVDLMLVQVQKELDAHEIKLEVSEEAKDLLCDKGYDVVFGARPLRRVIQNFVEDRLSEGLLESRFQPGDTVRIEREGDEIVMRPLALVESK